MMKLSDEVLSSAAEIKARGGLIIGVAPFESNEFDVLIKTPDLEDSDNFCQHHRRTTARILSWCWPRRRS